MPFEPQLSPFAGQVETGTRAFVHRFGLVPDEAARRHHANSLLGTLMARAYPHADLAELQLVTDWISCMLVLDDQFDETSLGLDPHAMRLVCARVQSWLTTDGCVSENQHGEAENSVIGTFRPAFADLWRRTAPQRSPTWRARLSAHVGAFFETCVWEAENRVAGRVPAMSEYIVMRGRALMPYLDLIEVTTRAEVPDDIYWSPDFCEMNQALSDADLWTNDLFSCEKEALLSDPHNLVLVHRHAGSGDLQTSANAVGALIQARVDRFTELSAAYVQQPADDEVLTGSAGMLHRHVAALRSWLSGQLQWRYETGRFDPTRPEVTSTAGSTPL